MSSFSSKFIISQVAGSCRLENILVSKQDEKIMSDIVSGKVDAATLRRQLVNQYRSQNSRSLVIAAS